MANVRPKPEATEWPTYIIDVDEWKIKKFAPIEASIWDASRGAWNYACLSYAWGKWHSDKTNWQKPGGDFPEFDAGIPVEERWDFPTLGKAFDGTMTPITVVNIKKLLKSMKLKYAWWDWACNVQGPADFLEKSKLKNPGIGKNDPQTLAEVQGLEVNKMRNVYSYSTAGCLWLHQFKWEVAGSPKASPIQLALEWGTKHIGASLTTVKMDDVKVFLGYLQSAQKDMASLTSVWSFQEAICLHRDDRIIPANATPVPILDLEAAPFYVHPDPQTANKGGVEVNSAGITGDYINDIANVATALVAEIGHVLEMKANGLALNPKDSEFSKACYNDEASARRLMSQFIASGFVAYFSNNPLGLLESKWSRSIISFYSAECDRTARAIMGALDLVIPAETLRQSTAEKVKAINAETKNLTQQGKDTKDAWKAGDPAECKVLKPAFLSALVDGYSWRILLHARAKTSIPNPGGKSWFTQFTDLPRPLFASLDPYIGETTLARQYQPRWPIPSRKPAPSSDSFQMPQLLIGPSPSQQLIAKANSTLMLYNFSTPSKSGKPFWTTGQFYEYVETPNDGSNPNKDYPGTVNYAQVDPSEVTKADGKMGSKVVALPFEKTTVVTKTGGEQRIRCFIFSDFDDSAKDKRTCNFRGVADFAGLSDDTRMALSKNMEIW